MSRVGRREAALDAGESQRMGVLFEPEAHAPGAPSGRGVPRTAAEWTGLVKVASGECNIGEALLSRLTELGLLETGSGLPSLTRHGRWTLGLSD